MSLSVLPNTQVLPAWNRLARAVEGLRIIGGDGINLVQTRNGIVINQDRRGPAFHGAWYVSRAGQDSLRIARGYVNALEPLIGDLPISDPDCTLSIPKAKDANKPRWVCLRVQVDDKGKIANPKKPTADDLTIVISDTGPKYAGKLAEHPLACLHKETLWQIAYFDYQHLTRVQGERITHFFTPA
jgi:hypothetical protein